MPKVTEEKMRSKRKEKPYHNDEDLNEDDGLRDNEGDHSRKRVRCANAH